MANKLPWFTHDHNARNDDFIRRLEDRFGHFGYAGYFKILEVLHEHGTGDILKITKSRLAQELRSRWPQVQLLLDFCRTSGKVESEISSSEVQLQIKKFRERQAKLKFKTPPRLREDSRKTPQEGEGEREVEKENGLPAQAPGSNGVQAKVKPAFKQFMDWFLSTYYGLKPGLDDPAARASVSAAYKQWGSAGSKILAFASGDAGRAIRGTNAIVDRMNKSSLDCNLATVSRHFLDWNVSPEAYELETKTGR